MALADRLDQEGWLDQEDHGERVALLVSEARLARSVLVAPQARAARLAPACADLADRKASLDREV